MEEKLWSQQMAVFRDRNEQIFVAIYMCWVHLYQQTWFYIVPQQLLIFIVDLTSCEQTNRPALVSNPEKT